MKMPVKENMKHLKPDMAGKTMAHRFWFQFCAVCLSLYTAYVVYLSKSQLFVSTADTLCSLLLFLLIAAGLYGLLLFVCKKLSGLGKKGTLAAERKRGLQWVWLGSLMISAFVLGATFLRHYPGGVSYDAANQWWQAHSGEYNNWHPVFHTLLIRLATLVVDRYPFVVLLQIAVYALAAGYLTATLYRHGVSAWVALSVHALVTLTPLVRNTLMYVWKDNAMTIGAVLLCAQTIRILMTRGEWLRQWRNAVCFGLMLAFTTLVRHNALLFTLPLVVIVVCCYVGSRRMAALACAVMVGCMLLVRGPLYGALDIVYPDNTVEEAVGLPMIVMGNIKQQQPDALDEETHFFLGQLATDEEWMTVYRPNDYNAIKFTFPRELVGEREAMEILGMAARAASKAPHTAFRAVNDTTDLVWGVDGQNEGVVTVSNSGDLPAESYGNATLNGVGSSLCAVMEAPLKLPPLRWLTENIGVQQLLLLLVTLWALYRSGTAVLSLAFPTLIYNLATMLLLCGNDVRFFQFTMAIALPTILAMLVLSPVPQKEDVTDATQGKQNN